MPGPPKLHCVPLVAATRAKSPAFVPVIVVAAFSVTLALPLFVMVTFAVVLVVLRAWLANA